MQAILVTRPAATQNSPFLPQQCSQACSQGTCWHAPQYIADLIRPVADLLSRASLRTALSGDLYVPRTRRRFGDRAFAVAAPREWNSLNQTPPVDNNIFQTPSVG